MLLSPGMEPLPGYVLVRHLGSGCIGDVWEASGPGGTAAALKFVRLAGASGIKEYRAIQRVKRLVHPNLNPISACWLLDAQGRPLAVHSVGQDQLAVDGSATTLVIAMLLGSMSLQTRLRHCREQNLPGIPSDELIGHMEDAAKGIDFLNRSDHGLGPDDPGPIQHGDIKPLNLLLVGNATQVCDFGLARALEDQRRSIASGTPAYMAPEICVGESPTQTTDQYSLAITYYELRTGDLPLHEEDLASITRVADAHRRNRLDFSKVSEGERAVLQRATRLQPGERFATTGEFVRKLRAALRELSLKETSLPEPHQATWAGDDLQEAVRGDTPQSVSDNLRKAPAGDLHGTLEHDTKWPAADTRSDERFVASSRRTQRDIGRTVKDEPKMEGPGRTRTWNDTSARRTPRAAMTMLVVTLLVVGAAASLLGLVLWPWLFPPKEDSPVTGPPVKTPLETHVETPIETHVEPKDESAEEKWRRALAAFDRGDFGAARAGRPSITDRQDALQACVLEQWQAHEDSIRALVLSQDGRTLLSSDWNESLRSWDVSQSGAPPPAVDLQGDGQPVLLDLSRDQDWIIGAGQSGLISLWQRSVLTPKAKARLEFPRIEGSNQPADVLAAAANATWLAASDQDRLAVWSLAEITDNAPAPRAVARVEATVESIVAVDGGFLTFDQRGRVLSWNCDDVRFGKLSPTVLYSEDVTGIVLAHRKDWLIAGNMSGAMRLWPFSVAEQAAKAGRALPQASYALQTPQQHECVAVDVGMAGQGKQLWVFLATLDNRLTIWNAATVGSPLQVSGEELTSGRSSGVVTIKSLACDNNGRLYVGLNRGEVLVLAVNRLVLTLTSDARSRSSPTN